MKRVTIFGIIILVVLLAFEIFNFSITHFALLDILGNIAFAGIRWATILAVAFCGIDFAGIARIFTPETGRDEPAEIWYLFAAWLIAAALNAILTWWGVSVAMITMGTTIPLIPVFVAGMIFLIRVLIIGTFSLAGERLLSVAE